MSILAIVLAVLYIITSIVGLLNEVFPTYKRNNKQFANFTIGDFILFLLFLPVELIYILFTNPTMGLLSFIKKRPFKKAILKIGDKVNFASKTREVLEVRLNERFEEIVRLSGYLEWEMQWFNSKDLKKISPLEELL